MAQTITLGNIDKLDVKWMGSYESTTTYVQNNLVFFMGNTFECKAESSLGIPPTNEINWTYAGKGQDLIGLTGSLPYHSREGQSEAHTQGFGSFLMHRGIKGTSTDPFVLTITVQEWGGAGVSHPFFAVNGEVRKMRPPELDRARFYKFDQSDSSNAGHPLYLGLTPKYSGVIVSTGSAARPNEFEDSGKITHFIDGVAVTIEQYHTIATFNAASTSRWIIFEVTNLPPNVIWYESSQVNKAGQRLHIEHSLNRMVSMNRMRGNQAHRKFVSMQKGIPGGWFPYIPGRLRKIGNQQEACNWSMESNHHISQLGDVLATGTSANAGRGGFGTVYQAMRQPYPFWFRGAKFTYDLSPFSSAMVDIDGNLWVWGPSSGYMLPFDNHSVASSTYHQYLPMLATFGQKCSGPNGRFGGPRVADIRTNSTENESSYESTGIALMEDGDVWTWGHNEQGDLGRGSQSTTDKTPGKIEGKYDMIGSCRAGNNVDRGGFWARDFDTGRLFYWGSNQEGHGGVGDDDIRTTPVEVLLPSGRYCILAVGMGSNGPASYDFDVNMDHTYSSFFLMDDGTVYACGSNDIGQLGLGYTSAWIETPSQITDLGDDCIGIYPMAGCIMTIVAIMRDGTIRTWGANYNGTVGIGTSTNYYTSPQNPLFKKTKKDSVNYNSPDHPPVVQVCSTGWDGYHAVYALKADGTIWSCGDNALGRLIRFGRAFGDRNIDDSEASPYAQTWIDDDAPNSVKNSVFGPVQTIAHKKVIAISGWHDSQDAGNLLCLTNEGEIFCPLTIGEVGGTLQGNRDGLQKIMTVG